MKISISNCHYFPAGGGGVTIIYAGTGRAIFDVLFFGQQIKNFRVSFLIDIDCGVLF